MQEFIQVHAHITALNIYPVKLLVSISLPSSEMDSMGLKYDRRSMLASSDGEFLSQRKMLQMVLIETALENRQLIQIKSSVPI